MFGVVLPARLGSSFQNRGKVISVAAIAATVVEEVAITYGRVIMRSRLHLTSIMSILCRLSQPGGNSADTLFKNQRERLRLPPDVRGETTCG